MVQPAPRPGALRSPSTNSDVTSSANDDGSSQNEMLFMRGNAISGAPIISGTIQLRKPPIIAGITMKKITITPGDSKPADHRRHPHEEDHDQAMRSHEHVIGVRLVENLYAGIHQLDADRDRHR